LVPDKTTHLIAVNNCLAIKGKIVFLREFKCYL